MNVFSLLSNNFIDFSQYAINLLKDFLSFFIFSSLFPVVLQNSLIQKSNNLLAKSFVPKYVDPSVDNTLKSITSFVIFSTFNKITSKVVFSN